MISHSIIVALLCVATLHAGPARHPSYEPVPPPASSTRANLFLKADVTASGHWDRQTPERAADENFDPGDHWACENLPVWHQLNPDQATELAAIRIVPYWGDGPIYQYPVEGSADGKN